MVGTNFHSMEKKTLKNVEVSGYQQLLSYQNYSKHYFVFIRRKKVIQVWNNLRVSKWWLNLSLYKYKYIIYDYPLVVGLSNVKINSDKLIEVEYLPTVTMCMG